MTQVPQIYVQDVRQQLALAAVTGCAFKGTTRASFPISATFPGWELLLTERISLRTLLEAAVLKRHYLRQLQYKKRPHCCGQFGKDFFNFLICFHAEKRLIVII